MERLVQFRDYQEQTAGDHNNIQAYAREAIDDLSRVLGTKAKRYSGLTLTKTGQVEVTVSPGLVFDGGPAFARRTSLTQSMSTYTAGAGRKVVTLTAYGVENETDDTQRDTVVDVETGEAEPRSVKMTKSRDVVLVFTPGADAAEPAPPPVPATHVVVAHILMDTTQVVSVAMVAENEMQSTDTLSTRAKALEIFKGQIEPRVGSLGADLADLANQIRRSPSAETLARVYLDVARVKAALKFPTNAAGYGSFPYLDRSYSDVLNEALLGFDAKVEEGVRFPPANEGQFAVALFSANDPNAKVNGGLLLPAYTEEMKLQTGDYTSELGIAQYGFQTLQTKTGYLSRSRIRYGGSYTQCSNGAYWGTAGQPSNATGLYDFNTQAIDVVGNITYINNAGYETSRVDTWWFDTWKEPYTYAVTVDGTITGALVAQTVLVSNDIWATRIGFHIAAKGGPEDIKVIVCEVTNGQPDLSKVMLTTSYPHASIVNGMNYVQIRPTFWQKGKRVGVILVSNANHKIGMTSGQSYIDGTFFYSTDGIYYQGDLTKDMILEVYGARFNASQVAIEFAALNLDGGIRDLDLLAEMWAPESTQLIFEIRPNGTGEWQPITRDNLNRLNAAPPLCQFRGRFIGTRDMMPAINLANSRVKISRAKTAFKHIHHPPEVVPTTSHIVVKVTLERFNEIPNDYDLALYVTAGPSGTVPRLETADSVVTRLVDAEAERYERTFIFDTAAPVTAFRFVQTGGTNSPLTLYHVAELDYYVV